MYERFRPGLILLIAAILPDTQSADADIIFQYKGSAFDDFAGTSAFTGADRITGTVTFEATGDTTAKAFSLSTTVGGLPGFSLDVPDVNTPGSLTVLANFFEWQGTSTPVDFILAVQGEVFGTTDGEEVLSIAAFGDAANIDASAQSDSYAFNFSPGTFTETAVPEPSSFVLLASAMLLAAMTHSLVLRAGVRH